MTPSPQAREIYQAHLDIVTDAVWRRDWATVARYIALRSRVRMLDAELLMDTEQDRLDSMISLRKSFDVMGATGYLRIVQDAWFTNDDRSEIKGRHRVYVMSGGSYALDPFDSAQELFLKDGLWIGHNLTANVSNRNLSVVAPETALRKAGAGGKPHSGGT